MRRGQREHLYVTLRNTIRERAGLRMRPVPILGDREIAMTRLKLVCVAGVMIGMAAVAARGAEPNRHNGFSITTDDRAELTDCGQVKMRFDERNAARAEQALNFSEADAPELRVHVTRNSAMRVQGWDRNEYEVKVCKAAAPNDDAQSRLAQISVARQGHELVVRGPADDDWAAYLIIQAPRVAGLDLESQNGEIGLHGTAGAVEARNSNGPLAFVKCSGKIEARTTNGPIEVRESAGQIRAQSSNGPIDYTGNSGDLHLRSENGPVSVALRGSDWKGAGLEATTENGPLTVNIPDAFQSGVRVESRGYSPVSCEAKACEHVNMHDKSYTLGSGPAVVQLSTVNGPVEIGRERSED